MQRQKVHTLVVTEGPMVGERYTLVNIISTLGRASGNTVVLESAQISRLHAQIRLQPTGVMIDDMGSINGTFVNGRRLTAPHPLSSGDLIRFAEFATLQYVAQDPSGAEGSVATRPVISTARIDDRSEVASTPSGLPSYARPVSTPRATPPSAAYEPVLPKQAPVDHRAGDTQAPTRRSAGAVGEPRRSTWLYGVIIILLVLICMCVALALYLWFAPVTFWERAFDLLGIPLPSHLLGFGPLLIEDLSHLVEDPVGAQIQRVVNACQDLAIGCVPSHRGPEPSQFLV